MFRMLCCAALVFALCDAQALAQTKDVPEAARHEIARRGALVEQLGTVQSDGVTAAIAHPPDDSFKWHLTLVIASKDPKSEAMCQTIAKDPAMRAWVDVDSVAKSNCHYQVKRFDDETQKDWLKPVREFIDQHGLPCLIVQPPLNGQYGKPSTIVKTIHGPVNGPELSTKLRDAIFTYVKCLKGETPAGVAQAEVPAGAVAPPFNVAPLPNQQTYAPVPSGLPFEYPAATPAVLSIDTIREACPGATPEFVLSIFEAKVTSVELAKLRWEVFQMKHPKREKCQAPTEGDPTPLREAETVPKQECQAPFCSPVCPDSNAMGTLAIVALMAFLSGAVSLGLMILLAGKIVDTVIRKKNEQTIRATAEPLRQAPPMTAFTGQGANQPMGFANAGPSATSGGMPPVPSVTPLANNG